MGARYTGGVAVASRDAVGFEGAMSEWQGAEYEGVATLQQWLADKSLASLTLAGTERVLDVGCGNGKVTAEIAARLPGGSALGVDPSHDMVEFARRTHVAPNLAFEVGDARTLSYRGRFDLVVSFNALHWVHEQDAALRGIHASLRPGGRAFLQMVSRGEREPLEDVIEEVCASPRWAASFAGHSAPHVHFAPDDYRAMAAAAGFRVEGIDVMDGSWDFRTREAFAHWAHATFVFWAGELPEDRRDAFIEDVLDRYGSIVFRFYQMRVSLLALAATGEQQQ
jgi:trans-aconitate 2-methyltransferase